MSERWDDRCTCHDIEDKVCPYHRKPSKKEIGYDKLKQENKRYLRLFRDIKNHLTEKIPQCPVCGEDMEIFGASNELYACISKHFEHTQYDRCTPMDSKIEEVLRWIEEKDIPLPKIKVKIVGCLDCEVCGKTVAKKDEENNTMLCFECYGKGDKDE